MTVDKALDFHNLDYAVLELDVPSCTENYQELDTTTGEERLLIARASRRQALDR